jgi:hypothetical protein
VNEVRTSIRLAAAIIDGSAVDVVARLQRLAETAEKPADRRKARQVLATYGLEPSPASPERARQSLGLSGG